MLEIRVLCPQLYIGEPEDFGFAPGDLDLVQRLQVFELFVSVLVENLTLNPVKLLEMKQSALELPETLVDVGEKMVGAADLGLGEDLGG